MAAGGLAILLAASLSVYLANQHTEATTSHLAIPANVEGNQIWSCTPSQALPHGTNITSAHVKTYTSTDVMITIVLDGVVTTSTATTPGAGDLSMTTDVYVASSPNDTRPYDFILGSFGGPWGLRLARQGSGFLDTAGKQLTWNHFNNVVRIRFNPELLTPDTPQIDQATISTSTLLERFQASGSRLGYFGIGGVNCPSGHFVPPTR